MHDKHNRWGFHPIFYKNYSHWNELETAIASIENTKEKGDAFEQFCYFFFLYNKDWLDLDDVWCDKIIGKEIPQEIRLKYKLEKSDFGIDGVNQLSSGKIEAWQSKFRSDHSQPTYTELSTFWAEAEYTEQRRIIANCKTLPIPAQKKKAHQQILLDQLLVLDSDFFESLYTFVADSRIEIQRKIFQPFDYQKNMINDVVGKFKQHDRGKLIAACGTGKTLVALWIAEHEAMAASKVLILVPSIALVGQTLKKWTLHSSIPFSYLAVCSDPDINSNLSIEDDGFDIDPLDLGIAVTTSPSDITQWLNQAHGKRQYMFSTYHSIDAIEEGLKQSEHDYEFDIIFFDEAHRTVGKGSQLFARALNNNRVPASKRLFMTATERLVNPRIKSFAEKAGIEVLSMGDLDTYGPTFHEYSFGKAIEDGVIADYEIVLAEVSDENEALIAANKLLEIERTQDDAEPITITAGQLFISLFLIKAMQTGQVKKTITFHSLRKRAINFNRAVSLLFERLKQSCEDIYITYILGNQNASERSERISNFELANRGVLSNVQVLSEGVDIPMVDSVYFVDPKTSLIDIVQAIGRALRKPYGVTEDKVAKVLVPILIPSETSSLEDIEWDAELQTFHNVIQAMRNQDERLEEEINQINLYAVSGGKKGHIVGGKSHKIRIIAPRLQLSEKIDLHSFLEKITMRIATANANPDGTSLGFSFLGKGERKSEYKPEFSILGDYNPQSYKEALIAPTLELIENEDARIPLASLKINHNNVSHAVRLGIIQQLPEKVGCLTELGRKLKRGDVTFEQVFKNQMMLYSSNGSLFPYRTVTSLLLRLDEMTHIEFLYGPYIIQASTGLFDIETAAARILFIRQHYPNIHSTSLANRDEVRLTLNEQFKVDVPEKDLWGDRSTPKNKFRYLKNALALFEFIADSDASYSTPIRMITSEKAEAAHILEISHPAHAPVVDYYGQWLWLRT